MHGEDNNWIQWPDEEYSTNKRQHQPTLARPNSCWHTKTPAERQTKKEHLTMRHTSTSPNSRGGRQTRRNALRRDNYTHGLSQTPQVVNNGNWLPYKKPHPQDGQHPSKGGMWWGHWITQTTDSGQCASESPLAMCKYAGIDMTLRNNTIDS